MTTTATQNGHAAPHNLEAEESLIGAMLLSNDAASAAIEICSPGDFYKPAHGHVFAAIRALHHRAEGVDYVTVVAELRRAGLLELVGDPAILVSLQANTPSTANAAHYARIVADHARHRRLMATAKELGDAGRQGDDERLGRLIESLPDGAGSSTGRREADALRLSLMDGNQLESLPTPEPLVDGIVDRGSLVSVYGPPGIGKSFLVMALSLSVATGSWWMGHRTTQGTVLYVAGEGSFGLAKRRRAWMTHERIPQVEGDHWLTRSVNLLDPAWSAALVDIAREIQPVLIVIDTIARSMSGGDENSSRDMGALVAAADDLRHATGATVALVHHTPRNGDNARGHSSLEGALDTAIHVQPGENGSFTLHCAKQKDAPEFPDMRLSLKVVGDSCVVVPSAAVPAQTVTDQARQLLQALDDVDLGAGVPSTTWHAVSANFGVALRSFHRTKKTLVELGLVGTNGTPARPLYTLTQQGKEELDRAE